MTQTTPHDEVLRLTQDLMAIESHKETEGRETAVAGFLRDWFTRHGIEATLQAVEGERANVLAKVPGGSGPSVLLNGHIDTVPAGDMRNAFAPEIRGDVLWGRGACDMKGAVAAMCCTLFELASAKVQLSGDLWFAGTVDEETGSLGVKALMESGFHADHAVVGEPTSLRVAIAHKGSSFLRIALTGRGAHGSRPELGVNAASYAARIVVAVEETLRTKLAGRRHPLLGESTVSVGRVCGGTQPNIVAERCEILIDRRYIPGEPAPIGEVRALVAEICDPVDGLSFQIEETPESSVVPHSPLDTRADSPVVSTASAVCGGLGLDATPIGVTYWTDGGHLAASGVDTVVLGPGDIAHAHGPSEHVRIGELEDAVSIYCGIIRRMLG